MENDHPVSWPQRPARLPMPLRLLVMVAILFGLFMAFELAWPGLDGVDWAENLVNAVALVLAMAAGDALAIRLYGADALEQKNPTHWRALGVFILTAAVVAFAIVGLGNLVT